MTPWQSIFGFLEKVFRTFKSNLIYLLLAFATPLLLYYVTQGQEIIAILFTRESVWNIALILVSFILLFNSIWVIPPWSLEGVRRIIKWMNNGQTFDHAQKRKLFHQLALELNTKLNGKPVFPIRYFAGIPLLMFVWMLAAQHWNIGSRWYYPAIYLSAMLLLTYWSQSGFNSLFKSLGKKLDLALLGHLGWIAGAMICWIFGWYFAGLFFMLMLHFYNNAYFHFIELGDLEQIRANYHKTRRKYALYWTLLLLFLVFFSLLTVWMELHNWSSVLIMNISFAVYISLIDLFIKTPNDVFRVLADIDIKEKILGDTADFRMEKIQKISEKAFPFFQLFKTVAILFLINYLFFDTFNQAHVRREIVLPNQYIDPSVRHSLESYYPKWSAQMDHSQPVVLIAGQGGGSRAGAWMAMNLERLFPLDSLHLLRNVFAISTVSGSSSGANMMLHKWQAAKKGIYPKIEQNKNRDFVKALYGYNYLSAAMWGLLWSDGIRAWFPTQSGFARDRNYYRQLDESKAFAGCYPDSSREQLEAYFHEDYLQRWQRDSAMFLPLFFVNTANTQAGKRCIVSPVALADSIFGTAIDLYQEIKRDSNTPIWSFPGVTAVNLSQAFPFVCNYNYVEGVGNMIDGGLYENSGANTVYEIYEFLRKKDSSLAFRIFLIQNSNNDNPNTNPVNSILKNTLSSALSTPFSGHSHYWEQWLIQKAKENGDEVVPVYLKDEKGWKDIPLGILLSEEKIEEMYGVMGRRN